MTLSANTILENRYQIEGMIAQGGMGAIYKARDLKLKNSVAIKQNALQTAHSNRQFEQEAIILARLRHPSLPRVIDHFSDTGHQYLVMDYIKGQDLWEIIRRQRKPLPEEQALHYMRQICDAVSYLHQQQPPVLHRDIKPQNIKITPEGQAVLVDFGIARVADENERTQLGARGHTPGFSPPEQYTRQGTNPTSDVYALGATLYALLTCKKPPHSVGRLSGMEEFHPPVMFNTEISPSISEAIVHAMQVEQERRPPSVAVWVNELSTSGGGAVAPPSNIDDAADTAETDDTYPPTVVAPSPQTETPASPPAPLEEPPTTMLTTVTTMFSSGQLSLALLVFGAAVGIIILAILFILLGGPGDTPVAAPPTATSQPIAGTDPTDTPTETPLPIAATNTIPRPTDTPAPEPTATATETPSPEPTATPRPVNCENEPTGRFADLWREYRNLAGCPISSVETIPLMAEQPFQGGHMFWRSDTDEVYIVLDRQFDGTSLEEGQWITNPDWDWAAVGEPDPEGVGLEPPPGFVEPKRGFGWVWRTYLEGPTGPLGWAVDAERGFEELAQAQQFDQGLAFSSSSGKEYLFIKDGPFYVY